MEATAVIYYIDVLRLATARWYWMVSGATMVIYIMVNEATGVIHNDEALGWHSVVISGDKQLWCYSVVISIDEPLWWHSVVIHNDEPLWWHSLVISSDKQLWWHSVVISGHEPLLWYSVVMSHCSGFCGDKRWWAAGDALWWLGSNFLDTQWQTTLTEYDSEALLTYFRCFRHSILLGC